MLNLNSTAAQVAYGRLMVWISNLFLCVICHTGSSLHPVVKLEPDRRRSHGGLRRTYFVHGEQLPRDTSAIARCFCGDNFDDFGLLCLHSLLEWLNPNPLNLNESTEDLVVIQRPRS